MKKIFINKKTKEIFKIILMITIIFFLNENSVCSDDSTCSSNKREGKCKIEEGKTSGYCEYMDGYNVDDYGNCLKNVDINEFCDSFYEICEGDNKECYNQICSCKSGYTYSIKSKKCEVTIKYGETCNDDICETKQKWGDDSKCTCLDGYTYNETEKKCQKRVNYQEKCNEYDICGANINYYNHIVFA